MAVPNFDHIFVILMSGKNFIDVFNPVNAPYINNTLIPTGGLATNFFAVDRPDTPNYLALTSGATHGTSGTNTLVVFNFPNLFVDRVGASGRTWKAYSENYVNNGNNAYNAFHNIPLQYSDIATDFTQLAKVVDFPHFLNDAANPTFQNDLRNGTVPSLSWITPNDINDMSVGQIGQGDNWLSIWVPQILNSQVWAQTDSLLIVVWTVDANANNQVPCILVSKFTPAGLRDSTLYNHYNVLGTIESAWGLSALSTNDGPAQAMTNFFPGLIPSTIPITYRTDAIIQRKAQLLATGVDGIIALASLKHVPIAYSTTADLKKSGIRVTHTVDASLIKRSAVYQVDAIAVPPAGKGLWRHQVDAIILSRTGTRSIVYSTTAILRNTSTLTYSVDAALGIFVRKSVIHSADAIIDAAWANNSYLFRRGVNLLSVDGAPAGHYVQVSLPYTSKVRSDFEDIEVVFADSSTGVPNNTVIGRSVTQSSTEILVEFQLAKDLSPGVTSAEEYYIYHGNPSLATPFTRPTYIANAWPIFLPYNGIGVAYMRPGEHWINGVSSQLGSISSFVFYGSKIQMLSQLDSDQGIAAVRMDDGAATDLDLYASSPVTQVVFEVDNLDATQHTFLTQVTGRHNPGTQDTTVNIVGFNYAKFITVIDMGEEINVSGWHSNLGGG